VRENGRVSFKRRPVRIDVSYMITCWTSATEDQHRLLWQVMETFFRHSPIPEDLVQGSLKHLVHLIRTEVAQPDGVLQNVSDFWGALENQMRPSISLVLTLDLDLNQLEEAPMVFAKAVKVGHPVIHYDVYGNEYRLKELAPGWDATPVRLGGLVHDDKGNVIEGASVRLIGTRMEGGPVQIGPTVQTGPDGRYVFGRIPPGDYTLVVEVTGRAPQQRPLKIAVGERGESLPELVHEVEVPMPKK
jgi:hypothetical protein